MKRPIWISLFIGGLMPLFLVSQASAQYGGFTEILPEELTQGDIELMKQAAREQMQDQPVGTINMWKNPESGNAGAAKLLRRFHLEERECMENRHYLLFKSKEQQVYDFVICREEGSEWIFTR